jgi:hypothetical protein
MTRLRHADQKEVGVEADFGGSQGTREAEGESYCLLPARDEGFLGWLDCESHSARQSLRHLPRQRKAIMLPPQAGQIRLRMAETMFAFSIPEAVSVVIVMISFLTVRHTFAARED